MGAAPSPAAPERLPQLQLFLLLFLLLLLPPRLLLWSPGFVSALLSHEVLLKKRERDRGKERDLLTWL